MTSTFWGASSSFSNSTSSKPTIMTLQCIVQGDYSPFPVDINFKDILNPTIGHLKNAICHAKKPEWDYFAPDRLVLWKTDILDEEGIENFVPQKNIPAGTYKPRSSYRIDEVFKDPIEDGHIYIVIESLPTPQTTLAQKRKAEEELSKQYPKSMRYFAAANAAHPSSNFFIEPKEMIDTAGKALDQGKFILIYGHRQSGKSSTCESLVRWLQKYRSDYDVFLVTLNKMIDLTNRDAFWQSLCNCMRGAYPDRFSFNNTDTVDHVLFAKFFSKQKYPKPSILLIDEASYLTSMYNDTTKDIIGSFISVLRPIQDSSAYSLYSLALIGTESVRMIIEHPRENGIPTVSQFSVDASWRSGRFSKGDIVDLLTQFAKANGMEPDFDTVNIAEDIFALTLGHKGLVGSCCRYIEVSFQTYSLIPPITKLDHWKKHTILDLPIHIMKSATYSSIIRTLGFLSPSQRTIMTNVLCHGFFIGNKDEDVEFLLAEGLVHEEEILLDGRIKLECGPPILRSLILNQI